MTKQNNIKLKRPHFKNLDGLRFMAALAVFIFHFVSELKTNITDLIDNVLYKKISFITSKGTLGVNFFFVLSGFLITYLILFELKTTHHFNLKNFLIRRTLRIWPLYFLIIAIGFFIFPVLFNDYHTSHHLINYVFFLANFDEIYYGANDSINFLTSPWSVAVEEQFYLFWGVLFFLLSKWMYNKSLSSLKLPVIIFALLLLSFIFRWNHFNQHRVIYYHTLSVMPDILIGALLGYFFIQKNKLLMQLKNLPKLWILLIYMLGFLLILFKNQIFYGHLLVVQRYVIALFFAFIILDQISFKNSLFKIENIKGTAYLGKISYGLYMYHLVVMFVLQKLINFNFTPAYISIALFFTLSVIITFLVSLASYKWFEKPFLNLKRKFS